MLGIFWAVQAYQKRDAPQGAAPQLEARTITGQQVSLATPREGAVLVHFWATWCPICRMEQGSIQRLAQDYSVISVASQSGEPAAVLAFMREQGLSFPAVADPAGYWASQFNVRAFPMSFIIDKYGVIRFVEIGFTSETGLRARLALAS